MPDIPKWVRKAAQFFLDPNNGLPLSAGWVPENEHGKRWSLVLDIHYPQDYMCYYVIDVLKPKHPEAVDGWYELEGTFWVKELADSAARKKTYYSQEPHRVRLVVWDG